MSHYFFKNKFVLCSILGSILAGLLLSSSYLPFFPWANLFCWIPLFWVLTHSKSSAKTCLIATFIALFIAEVIGFNWMAHMAHHFGGVPKPLAALTLLAFAATHHIDLMIGTYLWARYLKPRSTQIIGLWQLSLFYALSMVFVPRLITWSLGEAWVYWQIPWSQFVDIFGVFFLHTLSIAFGSWILSIYLRSNSEKNFKWVYRNFSIPFISFILINIFGLIYKNSWDKKLTQQTSIEKNIGLIQANAKKEGGVLHGSDAPKLVSSQYIQESKKLLIQNPKLDWIMWPEAAYFIPLDAYSRTSPYNRPLMSLLKNEKPYLITGAFSKKNGIYSNSIYYLGQSITDLIPMTHKSQLLAFGETIPLENTFKFLKKIRNFVPIANYSPGPGPEVRELDGIKLGPIICYEALFPWFSRKLANQGAQIYINLSNDSWYGEAFQPKQHLGISMGRSLENRLPMARVTNSGHSSFITPLGQLVKKSPTSQIWSGASQVRISERPIKTQYQKWGYWFFPSLTFLTFIFLCFRRKPQEKLK